MLVAAVLGTGSRIDAVDTPAGGAAIPPALRAANPDMLSGGVFAALEAEGAFGPRPRVHAVRAGLADLSKGRPPLVLDARVGANVRLGDDPAVLPIGEDSQAEPHIVRSITNPNLLLATFQEGRLIDAGALGCGYAISQDGGFTWTRALIPRLTYVNGGPFNRATDPVAGIGPQGDLYLNTLGSVSGAFRPAAVVISRSTDSGASWSHPMTVYQPGSSQISPDKNWLAVNTHTDTPTSGRLAVTWTNFTTTPAGSSTGNHLMAAVSDDRGLTWSTPVAITPQGSSNQGTQPVFLPDGSLVVVYITFLGSTTTRFAISCKRSLDGGRTFPVAATTIVPSVDGWDDPDVRDGVFLPSAAAAHDTGDLFVTYTAVVGGTSRVMLTRSNDWGATWTTPVPASDNPAGVSVMNPAVSASPDGGTVCVVFMDKRHASDGRNFVDHHLAQSLDGGITWQPNIRLTEMSSDIRYGALTTRGYMLGDYLGVAPAPDASHPFVAIWCDTRTGDADPFTVRFVPGESAGWSTWAIAHRSPGWMQDMDGDGLYDAAEYQLGTNPRQRESGETFVIRRPLPGALDVAWIERTVTAGVHVSTIEVVNEDFGSYPGGTELTAEQLPAAPLSGGVRWVGFRIEADPDTMLRLAHGLKFTAGVPPVATGEITAANTNARLINVATRGVVGTGTSRMIAGFAIDGPKAMLIRAAGPALAEFGITNPLPAPQFVLSGSGVSSVTAAKWQPDATPEALFGRLGAFPFAAGSNDAALLQNLAEGTYTAVVSDVGGSAGAALVEAYDADPTPGATTGSRVLNLSTRGQVGVGADALIAGFVITGSEPRRVLVRAVGPSLERFGIVDDALTDPVLAVIANGTAVAENDDWEISRSGPAIEAMGERLGAFPLNRASLDAAVLVTLNPGVYTAIVTGVGNGTGIALVEVYDAE